MCYLHNSLVASEKTFQKPQKNHLENQPKTHAHAQKKDDPNHKSKT